MTTHEFMAMVILVILMALESLLAEGINGTAAPSEDIQSLDDSVIPLAKGRRVLLPSTSPPHGFTNSSSPPSRGIRFGVASLSRCSSRCSPTLIDSLLLKIAAEHMGPSYCVRMPLRFSMDEVLKENIDVYEEPIWIKDMNYRFLYPQTEDDICTVVKRDVPKYQSIVQIFSPLIWTLTGICVLLVTAAQRLAGCRTDLLDSLHTFITGGFTKTTTRPVVNSLSLVLSAFGVIMVSLFCGRIMSCMAVNLKVAQLQTLHEVAARANRVYASPTLQQVAEDVPKEDVLWNFVGKMQSQWTWNQMEKDVAPSNESTLVISQQFYETIRRRPEWVDRASGRSLTHLVPQCVLAPGYPVYLVRWGWSGAEHLRTLQQHLVEAGIRHKIKSFCCSLRLVQANAGQVSSDQQFFHRREGYALLDTLPSKEPQALDLSAVREPLVLLGAGAALAACTLAAECVAHSLTRSQKRRYWGKEGRPFQGIHSTLSRMSP